MRNVHICKKNLCTSHICVLLSKTFIYHTLTLALNFEKVFKTKYSMIVNIRHHYVLYWITCTGSDESMLIHAMPK